jgi:hypothetical protein
MQADLVVKQKRGMHWTACHSAKSRARSLLVPRLKLKGERKMRVKLLTVFMAILTVSTVGFAQDVVSDLGKAAKDTGRVTKEAAQKTAHGTVKATKVTVHGSEKAVAETGRGSEKVAKGTEKAAKATAKGTEKAAAETGHGVKEAVVKI